MAARLSAAVSTAGTLITSTNKVPTDVLLSSGLLGVLAAFSAEDHAIGSVLSLLFVSLAVIGIVTVLLGARPGRSPAPRRVRAAAGARRVRCGSWPAGAGGRRPARAARGRGRGLLGILA